MTKMIAARFTPVAFAGFFRNDAVGAVRKPLKRYCRGSSLSHQAAEDASKSYEGLSHVHLRTVIAPRTLLLEDKAIRRVGL
jgi:hypothetical protein